MTGHRGVGGRVFEPIAITGLTTLLPVGPKGESLWQMVIDRISAVQVIPDDRWMGPSDISVPGLRRACLIGNRTTPPLVPGPQGQLVEHSPQITSLWNDLASLDPVFRVTLEIVAGAVASCPTLFRDQDLRSRTGVILGSIALPTDGAARITLELLRRQLRSEAGLPPNPAPLDWRDLDPVGLNARIAAEALGLHGGAFTLDAACASTYYAIELACERLQRGAADCMVAGGLSRPSVAYTNLGFQQLRALSSSGTCRPFDQAADGLVVGEGGGAVVLRRLSDAVRDGQPILGVIRAIGLSNDRSGSLLNPESAGQRRALAEAYALAGWRPGDVDLIECHGTGTPAGDSTEVATLRELVANLQNPGAGLGRIPIGSVKANVGHLLTGAGMPALAKVLSALRHTVLPPASQLETPSAKCAVDGTALTYLQQATPWTARRDGMPRRAALNGFGFGGINAHLLLEEWTGQDSAFQPTPSLTVPVMENLNPAPISPSRRYAIVGLGAAVGSAKCLKELLSCLDRGLPPSQPTNKSRRNLGLAEALLQALPRNSATEIREITELSGEVGCYRIPPAELPDTLPQHLLALQVAHEAWDQANIPADGLDPAKVGVWFGVGFDPSTTHHMTQWQAEALARNLAGGDGDSLEPWVEAVRKAAYEPLTAPRVMGALGSIVASRVSREFGLGGPSYVVSSSELAGLDALDCALASLRTARVQGALVGAVDFAADPRRRLASGRDDAADGACALLVLCEEIANRVGAKVLAYIEDTPTTAQSPQLHRGNCAILATGPVTEGDLIPMLSKKDDQDLPTALLEVDELLGNTGAARGLLALVMGAAIIQRRLLPPGNQHGIPLNIATSDQIHRPQVPQFWYRNRARGPRSLTLLAATVERTGQTELRQLVLSEAEEPRPHTSSSAERPWFDGPNPGWPQSGLFLLRSATFAADARNLASALGQIFVPDQIHSVAREFAKRHPIADGQPVGAAVVVSEGDDLGLLVRRLNNANSPSALADLSTVVTAPPQFPTGSRVAFVFPGSGSHHLGMGLAHGAHFPAVLHSLDLENDYLALQMALPLFAPLQQQFLGDWKTPALARAESALEPVIFAHVSHGITVATILQSLAVRPSACVGYSLGESTAYFSFGVWRDRDLMYQRMIGSDLFSRWLGGDCEAARLEWGLAPGEPVDWLTAVLPRPADEVRQQLLQHPRAYLLIVNTPTECVVGGWRPAVEQLARSLGTGLIPLPGVPTVHCQVARHAEKTYYDLHVFNTTPAPDITFYSVARCGPLEPTSEQAARSITDDALFGFDFPAVIEKMLADGVRVFVEIGPRAWTTRMIQRIAGDRAIAQGADTDGDNVLQPLLRALGLLAVTGNWNRMDLLYPALHVHQQSTAKRARWTVPVETYRSRLIVPQVTTRQKPAKAPTQPKDSPIPPTGGPLPTAQDSPPFMATITPRPQPSFQHHEAVQTPEWLAAFERAREAEARAHSIFLSMSQQAAEGMAALTAQLLGLDPGDSNGSSPQAQAVVSGVPEQQVAAGPAVRPFLDRDQCLQFARGSIAAVLGPEFAEVDTYPTRVRLPDEPLMLCDRVMLIEGTKGKLGPGRVVTEHDVLPDKWYLDEGRMPVCVAVESGQADLFLSAYLGIDFQTKGKRVYRLLDAEITFHRHLPVPGEVIRYDIHIDRFVQSGETWLFFFRFEGTIAGEPLLTMRNGCAGFFTYEEIEGSGGIVVTPEERRAFDLEGGLCTLPDLPVPGPVTRALSEAEVDAIRGGDLSPLGPSFARLPIHRPATIPGGLMRLVHRVVLIETKGGTHGLGFIRAEADIHPDDWFLTCHFVDDRVMPGTLMYECCAHTLRLLLLAKGWVCESGTVAYDTVPGRTAKLRCRGPVTEKSRLVTYEITITEIGTCPEPYVVAEAMMYGDGKPIVRFTGMSMRLTGIDYGQLQALWQGVAGSKPGLAAAPHESVEQQAGIVPLGDPHLPVGAAPALFSNESIVAFAEGNPSEAFGEPYRPFDFERRIARLPRDPYKFLDRITRIEGYRPFVLEAPVGAWIESQYDVPADAWYFPASGQGTMPFAVLLEVALQPCGWLAAYLGSALRSTVDLRFRNLGGTARLLRPVFPNSGILTVRVSLTKFSEAGGMIIQDFAMQVWQGSQCIYDGTTNFGFFTAEALANQLGIRDAGRRRWSLAMDASNGISVVLEKRPPFRPEDSVAGNTATKPRGLALPAASWLMVDRIEHRSLNGGRFGKGHLLASKRVNPDEWFFHAHFYQDPVCPGSLGLESFLQVLQWELMQRLQAEGRSLDGLVFDPIAVGADRPHTWIYRGQVIPSNSLVTLEASISHYDSGTTPRIRASGFLLVDGLPIYEMVDFEVVARPN